MDTTSCILGIICLVAPPFFAMLATQGLYSLARGNGFGHPCRLGFGIGMVGFLPMLLIVLGIKADAFFPELGGTFVVDVAAAVGLVLAVIAPIVWLRFLKSEDAQQDAWEEEDRRNREYLIGRQREQSGNYGRHADIR